MGKEALIDLMQTYGKVRPTDDGDQVLSLDWHDVSDLLRANGQDPTDDVVSNGQDPTDDVVKKLFDVADVDHNGYIDTNEFIAHQDLFLGGRPARIILVVGGPGSGKGVLCERLVRECGVVHVSSGELLRREVEEGTELGKQVEGIMKSGGLVSSAIMVALMQKHMRDHPGKRILLDGFPRSLENARDLVALCGKPELALHLECDDTILMERIMKRGASGERKDDNFETALHRIRTYHKAHDMTLQFLRDEHVPIVNLDCSATAEGVWSQLQSIGRLPRSLENARDLVTLCGKPELALHLECDDTILMERIMKRGASGKRKDDNFETALHRIRTYHKAHDMTLQFLRDEHVPIVNLDCSATAEGVWSQLQSIGRL
eukprot:CAMPEP_0113516892 /NCGR_PEP_ID=MMETSP0014_2-20120614/41893_1 /TAXON_ID=2857 /ORGANISM="Nitzschia sp." /LENGTH=374 /DNA_ID=CAMNT_0000413903 /DNA_START=24 /DNA_END=1144 /DNA_ORIENTATION=- /assembly_acc=CAM_ASM_000159